MLSSADLQFYYSIKINLNLQYKQIDITDKYKTFNFIQIPNLSKFCFLSFQEEKKIFAISLKKQQISSQFEFYARMVFYDEF